MRKSPESRSPALVIDEHGDRPALKGALDIRSLTDAEKLLKRQRGGKKVRAIDLAGLDALDTPGALLLCALRNDGVELTGVRSEHRALLDLVCGLDLKPLSKPRPVSRWREFVTQFGKGADEVWRDTLDIVTFVGRSASAVGYALIHPHELRLPSISRQVAETGVDALPIVGLLAVMISIVIAYQGVAQLPPYGGEDLTVALVAVSVLREMGVLITAILVAGRSGSAFTAEIGVMKAREEIDALTVMGLEPMGGLGVAPPVAPVINLSLRTFFSAMIGLLGGALIFHSLLCVLPL